MLLLNASNFQHVSNVSLQFVLLKPQSCTLNCPSACYHICFYGSPLYLSTLRIYNSRFSNDAYTVSYLYDLQSIPLWSAGCTRHPEHCIVCCLYLRKVEDNQQGGVVVHDVIKPWSEDG